LNVQNAQAKMGPWAAPPPARALTNHQIIQQQGETFILMYNEVTQVSL
jgi:hypothetical protein